MPISDAILGKYAKVLIHTESGEMLTENIITKFNDKQSKPPIKKDVMGQMNPVYIPDTGSETTGNITHLDRDGVLVKYLKENVFGQKLGDKYPKIDIEIVTKYRNGTELTDKYHDIIFTDKGRDFPPQDAVEITLDFTVGGDIE